MRKVLGFLSIAILCFAFCNSSQEVGLNKGDNAPEIKLADTKGKTIKLSSLKGKMVLIDFWASWCGPCRKENPNVVEAYNKYNKTKFRDGKGFEVFSVSLDQKKDAWIQAIEKDGLNWSNHVIDEEGKVSQKYNVRSIPSAYLINGKGEIIASGQELRGLGLHIALDSQIDL